MSQNVIGSHLAVMVSLNQNPLGTMANENFQVPANYRVPPARVYCINHSRTRKWKRKVVAVSYRRGADEALLLDKTLRDVYNADMLYRQVERGRDMNRYKEEVKPCIWQLAVPGGRFIPIPPAHEDTPDKPIMVEIPDGTWDIYLGNYDRMQGYAGVRPRADEKYDPKAIQDETQRLALRWCTRHNPVALVTVDDKTEDRKNPYGMLEFVRITSQPVEQILDREYLSALELFEAS